MTKIEKAIIDAVKAKHKELNTLHLPKQEILACIKEHTSHNAQTVFDLMRKKKVIKYNRNTGKYGLTRSLFNNFKIRDENNSDNIRVYLDYHVDELLEKLTKVIVYQSRIEIAEFFNEYYVDIDLVKTMDNKQSSRTLLPDIKPEEVSLQHVRVWLYKLYKVLYKFSSAYKEKEQEEEVVMKEVAAVVEDNKPKTKDGYYVLFDVISLSTSDKKNDSFFKLPHIRYFGTLEEAEDFKQRLPDVMYRDNGKEGIELHYYMPQVFKASEANPQTITLACSHLLPIDIEKVVPQSENIKINSENGIVQNIEIDIKINVKNETTKIEAVKSIKSNIAFIKEKVKEEINNYFQQYMYKEISYYSPEYLDEYLDDDLDNLMQCKNNCNICININHFKNEKYIIETEVDGNFIIEMIEEEIKKEELIFLIPNEESLNVDLANCIFNIIHHEMIECFYCGAFIDKNISKECPVCKSFICSKCGKCLCDYDDKNGYYESDDNYDCYIDDAGNYYDSYGEYHEVFDVFFGGVPERGW